MNEFRVITLYKPPNLCYNTTKKGGGPDGKKANTDKRKHSNRHKERAEASGESVTRGASQGNASSPCVFGDPACGDGYIPKLL